MDDRRLLERAAALGIDYVESVPERPVNPSATIEELRALLDRPLSDGPVDALEVIEELARDVEPGLTQMASGRYFGFVIGGALPVSIAADWLTSVWDKNALPGCEVLNEVVLNQVLIRFEDDAETDRVVAAVQESGEAWLGGTVWDDRRAIRISVSNWQTSEADVARLVAAFKAARASVVSDFSPDHASRASRREVDEGTILLLVGAILTASILAALGAARTGVPSLVAFLALGMLLGSDGLGGIEFDDAELARKVGIVCLVAILFEGGLSTSWRRLREVVVPASLLSTVGVAVTAVLTGGAAYLLFDLSPAEAVLLGAVVSSTDAAAVFATLRHSNIRRRLGRTLEAETGGNDPMAIALTIGLIDWIQKPNYGVADLALLLVRQVALGLAVGVVLGWVATRAFARIPASIGAFAPVASVAAAALSFGAADVMGGSGFLAVYLVGLAVGSTPSRYRQQLVSFHEGLAFLSQVAMFVVLGLLVFPHELPSVILSGLALAALLVFVIRPAAVFASTAFQGFTAREQALLGWAGLRGAVPIVLGTIVLSSGIGSGKTIFNAVFFVVLVSTVVQGTTLEWVAARLGLAARKPVAEAAPRTEALDVVDFPVEGDHAIAGSAVRELGLPRNALVAAIGRGAETISPDGGTVVEAGDHLFVVVPRTRRADLEDVISRWRRRV